MNTQTLTINATSAVNITTPSFNVTAPSSSFVGNVGIAGGLSMITSNGGSGDINAAGQVSDHKGSMDQMRGIYDGHSHNDPQGGTTGGPNQQM